MKKFIRIVIAVLLVIVAMALAAYAWAMSVATRKYETHWTTHDATFPIPWPLSDTQIDTLKHMHAAAGGDSLAGVDLQAMALERAVSSGRHLIESRVDCSGCHGRDFGGNVVINMPLVGYWAAPNLTSGEGSATRGFTTHDWDRAVRHGVRHNGQSSSMPSADFTNLSDHELSDIVAFLQSRPPVNRDVGHVRLGPVFAFVVATDPNALAAFSVDHQKPHEAEPPSAASNSLLGEHIVQVCRSCHGPNLSGGKLAGDPNMPIVGNITPHETGIRAGRRPTSFTRCAPASVRTGRRSTRRCRGRCTAR
jgi:mono/diheme cytochrome c family protein